MNLAKINTTWLLTLACILAAVWCLLVAFPAHAADYNCGAYGVGSYQNNVCGATTTSGGGGTLENTGQPIWPLIGSVALILLGTALLFYTSHQSRARRQAPPQ